MKRKQAPPQPALQEFSLFDNEERTAAEGEAMAAMLRQVAERLRQLSEAYRQSLREQQRLVRLSDRNQLELQTANRRLAEQAGELTRLNVALREEVARREALAQELHRQATVDVLTGTLTRRHFFTLAESALAAARRGGERLSLLLADLDHFKQINDLYGHAAGDEVLQHFGALCRRTLRQVDLVGRLGGEEFAVVLPKASLAAAETTARRLLSAASDSSVGLGAGGTLHYAVSIGVAEMQPDETIEALLARADAALYAAKAAGRSRYEVSRPEAGAARPVPAEESARPPAASLPLGAD